MRKREQRPVPQVERVADETNENHALSGEDRPVDACGRASDYERCRPEGGQQRPATWVARWPGHEKCCEDDDKPKDGQGVSE